MSLKLLQRQTALEARFHLSHVVLESLQRIELSRLDHDVVT